MLLSSASGSAKRVRASGIPSGLVGTWGKSITAATWRKNQISYEQPGHYTIQISKAAVTSIGLGGTQITTMRTVVSGSMLTFGRTADGFCPHNGSYRWSLAGRTLMIRLVKDDCDPRRVLLTAGFFKRQ
jgi:hypothetical protein